MQDLPSTRPNDDGQPLTLRDALENYPQFRRDLKAGLLAALTNENGPYAGDIAEITPGRQTSDNIIQMIAQLDASIAAATSLQEYIDFIRDRRPPHDLEWLLGDHTEINAHNAHEVQARVDCHVFNPDDLDRNDQMRIGWDEKIAAAMFLLTVM